MKALKKSHGKKLTTIEKEKERTIEQLSRELDQKLREKDEEVAKR